MTHCVSCCCKIPLMAPLLADSLCTYIKHQHVIKALSLLYFAAVSTDGFWCFSEKKSNSNSCTVYLLTVEPTEFICTILIMKPARLCASVRNDSKLVGGDSQILCTRTTECHNRPSFSFVCSTGRASDSSTSAHTATQPNKPKATFKPASVQHENNRSLIYLNGASQGC